MRRVMLSMILALNALAVCKAQQDPVEAVMMFLGTASEEDMDSYDVELLEELLRNPVRINLGSVARLEESGLMTHYQAVSLADYRKRHGDVMSLTELSAVDGFGEDYVRRLAPFISLDSFRLPSERWRDSLILEHELSARTAVKSGRHPSYGIKYRLKAGERLTVGFAATHTGVSASMKPDALSGNMSWRFRNQDCTLILGDYNARFGQGLAFWTGMSMGGAPSPSSMMKRSTGLTGSSSFTGSYAMRGAACAFALGRTRISSFISVSSSDNGFHLLPGLNVSVYNRNGLVSVTHYADMSLLSQNSSLNDMKTSLDLAMCVKGSDFFAEVAYDWKSAVIASLAGCVFPAGDDLKFGVMARAYPSAYSSSRSAAFRSLTKCCNEFSLSLSSELSSGKWVELEGRQGFVSTSRRHSAVFSVDMACFPEPKDDDDARSLQLKARIDWELILSGSWKMKFRLSERIRTWNDPYRTEIRTDLVLDSPPWSASMRADVVRCVGIGCLSYLEAGCSGNGDAVYVRAGMFKADDWEDRIYAYERDAPGSFNVPAYYGRGFWAAMTARWRFSRWGKLYFRAAATSYVFMKEKKPGKAELKFQLEVDL